MHRQGTIQKRLFLCFGIILLTALGNSVYALLALRNMRMELKSEVLGDSAVLNDARQIAISIANMRTAMRGISLFSMMNKPDQMNEARGAFEKSNQAAVKAVEEIEAQNLSAEDHDMVEGIRSQLSEWMNDFGQFADLSASGRGREASELALKQITPILNVLQKAAENLGSRSLEGERQATQAMETSMNRSQASNWLLVVLMLAAAAATLLIVARMVRGLKDIAHSFLAGAEEVMRAAEQVSVSSQALAQQSSEQAASLEETSASSEEINSMARRNSENSQASATIAGQSGQRFLDMSGSLDEMVSGMDEISASSNKISKIIKVIDEIAFQTNILALNAAVEAARAGESGMGFAVVADEVRNLAQRSAQAAKDTAELIEESIARSGSGKAKVDQVANSIRTIASEGAKVKELADEVNLGSQEQLKGIEEIGKSIAQMEQTTQATAANAEESAAASEQLKAQSEMLNEVATRLSGMLAVH